MPWFKQLLVTWDTTAAYAVTEQHLVVTQQYQHTAMQCETPSIWPLSESGWFSASASGNTAPSDYHQCIVQQGTDILASFVTQQTQERYVFQTHSKSMQNEYCICCPETWKCCLPSSCDLGNPNWWGKKQQGRAQDALAEWHVIQPVIEQAARFSINSPCVMDSDSSPISSTSKGQRNSNTCPLEVPQLHNMLKEVCNFK